MTDVAILVGLGTVLGMVIGFVLGLESRWRCRECLSEAGGRYHNGYKDGFRDGAGSTVELIRKRLGHIELIGGPAWVIEEHELERILEELAETAYV